MTTSTFLTIIGIVVTVVLGAWGVYLAIAQRYPGRITFVKEDCIAIFDSIVRNLPELSVTYKDRPIAENLVLLKGFLLNTGSKDITAAMTEGRLSIYLPEEHRWLTANVVSASPNVRASIECSGVALVFNLGLFRRGEHVGFEALAEVPTGGARGERTLGETLERAMIFHHRIADTRKVDRQELLTESQQKQWGTRPIHMITAFIMALAAACLVVWIDASQAEFQYSLATRDFGVIDVTVSPRLDGTVELRGLQGKFTEVLPMKTFYSERKWERRIAPHGVNKPFAFGMAGLFTLLMAAVVAVIKEMRRARRLRRLLGAR